jgi:hypothetical protein
VIKQLLHGLINEAQLEQRVRGIFDNLAHTEQRNVVVNLLKTIAELHLNTLEGNDTAHDRMIVSAAAGVINGVVANDAKYMSYLVTWLTNATGAGVGDAIGIRRAVLAVIASDRDSITSVFEKSLNQFGDFLYIKHTPMLQQEGTYEILSRHDQFADLSISACTGALVERGLCPETGIFQAIFDSKIRGLYEHGLEEVRSIPNARAVAGYDCW